MSGADNNTFPEAAVKRCLTLSISMRGKDMLAKKKHAQIIEIMEKKNEISVSELAERLNCTPMTVRRNLDELEEMNFITRKRGYAVLLAPARNTDFYEQSDKNAAQKHEIAREAFSFIDEGSSICLDSGTTTQQLVNLIPGNFHLSVITPSLTAAMVLSNCPDVQVLIPRGMLHHSNRSVLIDESGLGEGFRADVAFLSCRSLRIPGGTFEHSMSLTRTKQLLSKMAETNILLLDYSKWGASSLCPTIPLDDIDVIITDNGAPEEAVREAEKAGIEIIIADPAPDGKAVHLNQGMRRRDRA